MIQATIAELRAATPTLGTLLQRKMDGAMALRVAKLIRAVKSELDDFEAARAALCDRLGTLPEGATNYEFTPGAGAEFEAGFAAMSEATVELPGEKINACDLGDITPDEALSVLWLLED